MSDLSTAPSDLESRLQAALSGEVRFDRSTRILYSTDASIYQIEPIGVVLPRNIEDVTRLVRICRETQTPLLPRGGGTSLAGQTVGQAIVCDFSRHMDRILEINPEECWAYVEPGVIQSELNRAVESVGLRLGPDTATSHQAVLGGMIGNNSCGSRSLVYGKTSDHIRELEVILSDGTCTTLRSLSREQAKLRAQEQDLLGGIYREALSIIEQEQDEIRNRFPSLSRRVSGYDLPSLLGDRVDLCRLIAGSEGTLAVVVGAKMGLVPLPPRSGLLVLHCQDLIEAVEATHPALQAAPSAIELLDDMVLDLAHQSHATRKKLHFLEGRPQAVLIMEFPGETEEEIHIHFAEAKKLLREAGFTGPFTQTTDAQCVADIWAVRKAGLPLLLSNPDPRKPVSFVEDSAVPVDKLAEYVRGFRSIVAKYQTRAAFFAHASVGCLHIRPLIDLKKGEEVEKMRQISHEVMTLVISLGGSVSGEHGDGLSRSLHLKQMYGDRIIHCFKRIKTAFDPQGILNPGKIVDPPPMTENLRYGAAYQTTSAEGRFQYPYDRNQALAIELCNGAGVCRKRNEGTMCPSFMATREEEHSTRGRANLLRASIDGRFKDLPDSHRILDNALDLCLECKACKAECPSGVDMARLKSEYLQERHLQFGARPRDRFFASVRSMARWGSRLNPLSFWLQNLPGFRAIQQSIFGVDSRRDLPRFQSQTFSKWFRSRPKSHSDSPRPPALLFIDTFTEYQFPEIGRSATHVLERLGYRIIPFARGCCMRPMISRGFLDRVRPLLMKTRDQILQTVDSSVPIIGLEPGCVSVFRDELPSLLPDASSEELCSRFHTFEEFLAQNDQLSNLLQTSIPSIPSTYAHIHCHARALHGDAPWNQLLQSLPGSDHRIHPGGCCGMAGSFGYEKEHYEISMRIGQPLFESIGKLAKGSLVIASGTSCRSQIHDGAGVRAIHPAIFLDQSLRTQDVKTP
ncbi:MAG: FAD-linked oxidase C-terminal domain-containing protein [Planctomycetota bacterium]|nr:FAD-linked oxidase C-terminal domain-containing protein [Planctomycetota bacterium]